MLAQNKAKGIKDVVAKNIIIFVGDGMGPATVTAARIYKGQKQGKNGEEENLSFDLFENVGLAKVRKQIVVMWF